MTHSMYWPGVGRTAPKKLPRDHFAALIDTFHDLRLHPELDEAMEHLAAAVRGVEAFLDPAKITFASDFPARTVTASIGGVEAATEDTYVEADDLKVLAESKPASTTIPVTDWLTKDGEGAPIEGGAAVSLAIVVRPPVKGSWTAAQAVDLARDLYRRPQSS